MIKLNKKQWQTAVFAAMFVVLQFFTLKAAALTFKDAEGNTFTINKPAERIISMYSAHTENLFSLGAGNRVLGGHSTCIYPPEAAFLPVFNYTGNAEEVIAAEPDLVIIRPFISAKAPRYIAELKNAGITVVSLYPESFSAFDDYIRILAGLTGTTEAAEKLLSKFHTDISDISAKIKSGRSKPYVFFESTEKDIRTVSPKSMPGLAIVFAGGSNIAGSETPLSDSTSIAPFGIEKLLDKADIIDVYISQRGAMNAGGSVESIMKRPGFQTIKAVKNKHVYLIDEKLISSPTFRFSKGVEELARFFYPELIDDLSNYASARKKQAATKRDLANILVKAKHLPVYVPSSPQYYTQKQTGHIFGLFVDMPWTDKDFAAAETAVFYNYISWTKSPDGTEYFHPDAPVTREELSYSLFAAGKFKAEKPQLKIADIDTCLYKDAVQTLVDRGIFNLEGGRFSPQKKLDCGEIIDILKKYGI